MVSSVVPSTSTTTKEEVVRCQECSVHKKQQEKEEEETSVVQIFQECTVTNRIMSKQIYLTSEPTDLRRRRWDYVVQPHHTKQRTYRLPYGEARIGSNNVFKVLLLGGMRGDRLSY